MTELQQRIKTLDGYLVGISAGDSQDVQACGLLPRHLDIVFGAVVSALVQRGARLAYGGDLRQRGFTQQLYENVAEAYADEYLLGDGPGTPPFVHYLAAGIWQGLPPAELENWLATSAGLVEVRFMTGERYAAVTKGEDKFQIRSGPQGQDGAGVGLSSASEVLQWLQKATPGKAEAAPSLAAMRIIMGRECDARILLGGRMFDYRGDEPGIGAEARESLSQGAAVLPLGGFGGAARDVARQIDLWPKSSSDRRETMPRGPGYQKVMDAIADQRGLEFQYLGGRIEQARQLAATTDTKEAARLVVAILEGLPRRQPRAAR